MYKRFLSFRPVVATNGVPHICFKSSRGSATQLIRIIGFFQEDICRDDVRDRVNTAVQLWLHYIAALI